MTGAWKRPAGAALALTGLALILVLTLTPAAGPDTGAFRWCLLCGDVGTADFVANVALFVPLAAGLVLLGWRARGTVAAAVLLATAIEITQLAIPGRESTLGDIVAAGLGAAAVLLVRRLWPARRSTRAGLLAAALWLALVGAAGYLLGPSLPPTVWFGQWTAALGGYEWYRGSVVSATLGGARLPDGRLPDSRAARASLAAGEPLVVRAFAGPRTARLAPLFSVADSAYRSIVLLGADRDDLVLLVRRRAADLGLFEPDLRWSGALASVRPGDTLALEVRGAGAGDCLSLNGRERCGLGYRIGRAWALVHFVPGLRPGVLAALDCSFVALPALLVGLLVRRDAAGAASALVALGGLAGLPPALGLLPTPAVQLAASALGLAAGALAPHGGERRDAPVDAGVG